MKVQISIKSLIKESFVLFKENILILLGLIFGGIVFALLLSIPTTFQIGGIAGATASTFLRVIFQVIFSGMLIKYCLMAIKGYDPGFKEILPSVAQCLNLIGFSLLTSIFAVPYFVLMGSAMYMSASPEMLPGWIIVALVIYTLCLIYIFTFKLWAVSYLILDKNDGVIKSIKKSWKITKGNEFSFLKIILISALFMIVGLIALIIGVFVALAFSSLLLTLYYSKIATQLNDGEETTSYEE